MIMNSQSSSIMAVNRHILVDGKQPDQISEECSICCEKVVDKAFVNNCLHYFCYNCIIQWINVRAVCPLCVQPIDGIISNVRSADDYDLQTVEPPEIDVLSNLYDDDVVLWGPMADSLNDDDDVEISDDDTGSDGTVPVNLWSGSEEDSASAYRDVMDEDYNDFSDNSLRDVELTSDFEADLLNSEDEDVNKSCQTTDSEMDCDSTWFENDYENDEYENNSGNDSGEISDGLLNSSYDNLCDSDVNNYSADSEYDESAGSIYSEYHTDEDDYDHDSSYDDSFD